MAFTLPDLPYADTALEPYYSQKTLSFHHGKHHQTYVTNLNNLLENHKLKSAELTEIMQASYDKEDMIGIYNNSAQIWNHTFFWHSMKPKGGGTPEGSLLKKIESDFGSYEDFAAAFKNAATTQFGSGWAWLCQDKSGTLKIVKTANAVCPLQLGLKPLLTCDVWEHAYYLDYQNRRPDFVQAFLDHLLNWQFVEENLS